MNQRRLHKRAPFSNKPNKYRQHGKLFHANVSVCHQRKNQSTCQSKRIEMKWQVVVVICMKFTRFIVFYIFWFASDFVCARAKKRKKPDRKRSILLWAVIIVACRLIANSHIFLICVHLYHRNVCWFPQKNRDRLRINWNWDDKKIIYSVTYWSS